MEIRTEVEPHIGLYGIAKAFVGFMASSIGSRLNVEHPISRFVLAVGFFHFHQGVIALTKRLLLAQHEPFLTTPLLIASLVNAVLAMALFPLRSEEHTSELQSRGHLVCRLLLEKKNSIIRSFSSTDNIDICSFPIT